MKLTVDDVRNPLEARILKDFLSYERATEYRELTYEAETLTYSIPRTYVPDFVVELSNGHKIYIEVKGYLRRDDEKKLLAVRRDHPDVDLRIVFDKDNKLAGRKMRYSEWCTKHGILYAVGHLPKEWLIP